MAYQPHEKATPPPMGAGQAQVPGQYPQYPQYAPPAQAPQYAPPAQAPQYAPPAQAPQYPGHQPQYAPPPQAPPQAVQSPYGAQPQQPQYPQQQYGGAPQPYPTIVVQQPLPGVGMTYASAGGNRNVKNLPRNAMGQRDWGFGLCDCFDDCGTCMFGCCCPCMLYAQVKQRLDYLNVYARPDPMRGGSGLDANCLVWSAVHAVTGCGFILQAMNRGQMRNRYNIEGNGVGDFCTAWCCTPCELTQEHRELELEEQSLMQSA